MIKTLKGRQSHWPKKPLCPVCRKQKVFEPHSFVVLGSWTLLADPDGKTAKAAGDLDVSLELLYHGAHDSGIGDRRDIMVSSKIAESVHGGQVEFYFCSPQCVKKFLCDWVDEFEQKIEKEHNHTSQRSARPRRVRKR